MDQLNAGWVTEMALSLLGDYYDVDKSWPYWTFTPRRGFVYFHAPCAPLIAEHPTPRHLNPVKLVLDQYVVDMAPGVGELEALNFVVDRICARIRSARSEYEFGRSPAYNCT